MVAGCVSRAYEEVLQETGGDHGAAYRRAWDALRVAAANRDGSAEHPEQMADRSEERYLRGCLGLLKGEYTAQLMQPHRDSQAVVVATIKHQNTPSPDDAHLPGKTCKVVFKSRGKCGDRAASEESHYKLARFLGLGRAVAPCIAFSIDMKAASADAPPTLQCELQPLFAKALKDSPYLPDVLHCTAELFVPLLSASINEALYGEEAGVGAAVEPVPGGGGTGGGPVPYALSDPRLAFLKRFLTASGGCDLAQAFLSTRSGVELLQRLGQEPCGCDRSIFGTVEDHDFAQLLRLVSQESLEALILMVVVGFQKDGGFSNLMVSVRRKARGDSNDAGFEADVVCIDNTGVLSEHCEDRVFLAGADDARDGGYRFPAALGFPGALQPLSEGMRARILQWDPAELDSLLRSCLLFNGHPALSAVQKCVDRVRKLQHLVTSHPRISLMQLALDVVPCYARDLPAARKRGELGPLLDIQDIIRDARPLDDWAAEAEVERQGERLMQALGGVAQTLAAGATALLIWSAAKAAYAALRRGG